MSVLWTSESFW